MSGGRFNYKQYQLIYLADEIEEEFINDGKFIDEDFSQDIGWNKKRPMVEFDRLGEANDEERIIILNEVRQLIKDLRTTSERVKYLDYFLSSDWGVENYLYKLNKLKSDEKQIEEKSKKKN